MGRECGDWLMRCWAPRLSGRKVARQPKGRYGWLPAPRLGGDDGDMIRLSSFTPRMWLILVHDLLATAAAVLASFFIRFEEAGLGGALAAAWRSCCRRSSSMPASSMPSSGSTRRSGASPRCPTSTTSCAPRPCSRVSLLVLDYVLVAPNVYGTFFFGKITIVALLAAADRVPRRTAHRLSLLPLFAHAAARQGRRCRRRSWCSAAPPTPRCCCARSRAAR